MKCYHKNGFDTYLYCYMKFLSIVSKRRDNTKANLPLTYIAIQSASEYLQKPQRDDVNVN